jgi:uncharacterized hydrophobic protein (TIGR00271 family)
VEPARSPQVAVDPIPWHQRLAVAFGVTPADRDLVVRSMLERTWRGSAGYWLQLVLAMGIASLGLVLGSTAVVIGAMLISPLMTPIVEVGMGLAIGSPLLVLRSLAQTAASIVIVVGSAALLTVGLPFHEVTAEISARTAPTALDLGVAAFCAVSAAYTTMRPRTDTASSAAGTAIGISLVPPLCVVGYGLGTRAPAIASGAALLFTANLCAIVLLTVLCFLVVGYGHGSVHAGELEREELARGGRGVIRALARGLAAVFASKYGPALRVVMPLALVAVVFVPLREALVEVSWQVRVRELIKRELDTLAGDAVRSTVTVDGRAVTVRLVRLGSAADAARLERGLRDRIAVGAGVTPKVRVVAVADATALDEIAAAVRTPAPPDPVPQPRPDLLVRERVGGALARQWPPESTAPVGWRLALTADDRPRLVVAHAGPELGAAALSLLGRAIARDAEIDLVTSEIAFPPEPVTAEPDAALAWLPRALRLAERVGDWPAARACVEAPAGLRGPAQRDAEAVENALRETTAWAAARLEIAQGRRWSIAARVGPCDDGDATQPPPRDAGAPDASPR